MEKHQPIIIRISERYKSCTESFYKHLKKYFTIYYYWVEVQKCSHPTYIFRGNVLHMKNGEC